MPAPATSAQWDPDSVHDRQEPAIVVKAKKRRLDIQTGEERLSFLDGLLQLPHRLIAHSPAYTRAR